MSLFHDAKAASYRALRAASQGASVSLLHKTGEYLATGPCAISIAATLGTHAVCEEGIPTFRVPIEEMATVCAKLAAKHSVALLDVELDRFVLVWKIPCVPAQEEPASQNLDDY